MKDLSRRRFLGQSFAAGAATAVTWAGSGLTGSWAAAADKAPLAAKPGAKMRLGLVTYLWGRDWDLPTLIANCEKSKVLGVELRTTHKHGVERQLDKRQRADVKRRFDDSPVVFVGPGSNERFDSPNADTLKKAIEATKQFVLLSHDTGGSGVKVKPDTFHKDVPRETTIKQIGGALNELGEYAAGLGQQIRLEVHGGCAQLPDIKAIMDVATHKNVGVCWNCNPQDLAGKGLKYNFDLVKRRLGRTLHIHELNSKYPYQQLINLVVEIDYDGWVLLECSSKPKDRVKALHEQRELFAQMVAKAQETLASN